MGKEKDMEILLRRKGLLNIENLPEAEYKGNIEFSDEIADFLSEGFKREMRAATVARNMSTYGYIPSKELFDKMVKDERVSLSIQENIVPLLSEYKSGDVQYHPMYKNFPYEVVEMSEAELYLNAIAHYWADGKLLPQSLKEERLPFSDNVKLKEIGIGTEKDLDALFSNMLNSPIPFSPQDKEDIQYLMENRDVFSYMPDFIVNRENMATLCGMCYNMANEKQDKVSSLYCFKPQVRSVNDVLRIMNVIHGNGDATLSEKPTIKKVGRAERKAYLNLIEDCKNKNEDMKINKSQWIRVGEILHPGEYQKQYPKAYDAFQHMRDIHLLKGVKTYNARLEEMLVSGDINKVSEFAEEKPGAFARYLDKLMRDAQNPDEIIDIYNKCGENIAPNLLWQVHSHFKRHIEEYNQDRLRIFSTISNSASKTKVMEDTTKKIDINFYKKVVDVTEKTLKNIYKDKPQMGKVYISPEVAHCKIPNATRDASKGSVPISKGSHIPMDGDKNTIRGFIWWTNPKDDNIYGRMDVDLSAAFLDKDLKLIDRCTYYNLKGDHKYFCHSGDIVDGGKFDGAGVAEFIDINMEEAKKHGIRYAVFSVNSYTMQQFKDLEHIRFGYMERDKELEGEIFEPASVKQSIKLNAPSTTAITCMFDLEKREMIWMDEVGQDVFRNSSINNLDENWKGTSMVCYKALHMEKPDIYDVIRINAEARGGEIVYKKDDADLVFAMDEGIKPTDLDYFAGELLPKEVAKDFIAEEKTEEKEEVQKEKEEDEFSL